MKNKLLTFSLLLTIFLAPALKADEGMWIPLLIEKYNIKLMQEKGFKLTIGYGHATQATFHFSGFMPIKTTNPLNFLKIMSPINLNIISQYH